MIVVPLSGDTVETKSGVKSNVISYSNYGNSGPAVYVDALDTNAKSVSVPYNVIVAINETPVSLTSGKVFKSSGRIKRSIQLPQPEDMVIVNQVAYVVKELKLAQRGDLSRGLIIVAENYDTKEETEINARDISKIKRATGSDLFSQRTFQSLYKDYLGSTPKASE